ncbi:MAG TPA: hypothetical protein VE135_06550 [Pyrinomonadaceae bacterium]|nr:hypothetical protein [Pyrinomonadaceae bacterium]
MKGPNFSWYIYQLIRLKEYFVDLNFIRLTLLLLALVAPAALSFIDGHKSVALPSEERTTLATLRKIAIQNSASRNTKSLLLSGQPAVVTWKGSQNNLWSNPRNWDVGRVPGPTEVARFTKLSGSDVRVDANSPGLVGALILESDYRGTVNLKKNLTVASELLLAGGTFSQGDYDLNVTAYHQIGGAFEGGGAVLSIEDAAVVSGGTMLTSKWMTAESLTIESPAVVTMSRNSKLNLMGEGEPLKGDGLLDIHKNGSASVEYSARANADVTAATPIRRALGVDISRPQLLSELHGLGSQQSNVPALNGFSRAGSLTMTAKEDHPFAAVIDTLNGFAYFGTLTSPGIVVKVRLSDFTRVGALVLDSGENELRSAEIDAVNGFAYFGSLSGHIVKVQLSNFTRIGSFNVGGPLATAVIDTTRGFAYFGAFTGPGAIVKLRLSDFTPVDVLTLNNGEDGLLSAVIDTANGFAYFGTDNSPGVVVKIRLSDFTRVAGLTLNVGEDELTCAVIDTTNGFAYFGSFGNFFNIIKVRLSDLTRVNGIFENNGQQLIRSAVIDTGNGFAYFGDNSGVVSRIRLSDFTHVGSLVMAQIESELNCAVIDPTNGFIYFGHGIRQGVVKVRVSDFSRVGNLPLSRGEDHLDCGVIDAANGFAYFGTGANPGLIIKVRLSDFTRVGVLALDDTPEASNEIFLRSAVIDTANGFAYFGSDTSPGAVIKVRLSDFTRVGKITLNSGEGALFAAVIDTSNGLAYFSSVSSPSRGILVKIRLSDFTRVGSLTLNDGERGVCGVIDPANGLAYFGVANAVVKVQLSDFSRVGALPLSMSPLSAAIDTANGFGYFAGSSNRITKVRLSDFTAVADLMTNAVESNLQSAVIDPTNGFAYFGTLTSPGRVVKVRLSDFTRVDALTLNPGEDYLTSAVMDSGNASAYFGTGTLPGRIVKINLADASPTPTPTPSPTPTPTPSPTPTDGPPQLLLEESGPSTNQAAALDSIVFLRDPFPVVNAANLLNPGPDRNTRVVLFVSNLVLLQGEPSSVVVVNLVDGNNQSYDIPAEDVRPVPNLGFVQVIFRLPDNLAVGACSIIIRAHGEVSNTGIIRIRI